MRETGTKGVIEYGQRLMCAGLVTALSPRKSLLTDYTLPDGQLLVSRQHIRIEL